MKITVLPGHELTPDLLFAWAELQRGNPDLASPFFHPEFTRIVALVRTDVEVAVVQDGGKIVAFFPFQREHGSIGQPVGLGISDYDGLICDRAFEIEPREMLKACALEVWNFRNLLATQRSFAAFHHRSIRSPVINLADGFRAYVAGCHAARVERIKLRRLARDFGPLRFQIRESESALLQSVLAWKSAQLQKRSQSHIAGMQWARDVIERIHATDLPGFGGMLSVLYAGDRIVAGHLGLRSHSVWHYWMPAYPAEYSRYSPGIALLLKMAESAGDLELPVIDLGVGDYLYKKRFKNEEVELAAGSVEHMSLPYVWRRFNGGLRRIVLASPLRGPARGVVRSARNLRAWLGP